MSSLHAQGRSLADFGELSPGEARLRDCSRIGIMASVGKKLPEKETAENRVRADFVRFLALGGDEQTPVHERGIELEGAWLRGVLDLEGVRLTCGLLLHFCRVERIRAYGARLVSLNLTGSHVVEAFNGDGLRCEGSVYLRKGFHAKSGVRLLGAVIDGDLDCSDGRFENSQAEAIFGDGMQIGGMAFLAGSFHAQGPVRFHSAKFGMGLHCGGARFEYAKGAALSCDCAIVCGNLSLNDGFHATGSVRLIGATISGDLDCIDGTFENPGGLALQCERAEVRGTFFFITVRSISGAIILSSAHVRGLCDDMKSWCGSKGRIILDGFTYDSFIGTAPTRAATRVAWLRLQHPADLGPEFRPQPWEQLVAVFRKMGHMDEARCIAIEKQKQLRRAGKLPRGARVFHWLYGALVGYGYRPMRLVGVTTTVWLLCALTYWWATNPGGWGPRFHLIEPTAVEKGAAPADYRNFVPLVYSADVLLPVIDLGYKEEWQPAVHDGGGPQLAGQLLRFLYWFEIAFGWIAGLLLVAVLGNLIKKD